MYVCIPVCLYVGWSVVSPFYWVVSSVFYLVVRLPSFVRPSSDHDVPGCCQIGRTHQLGTSKIPLCVSTWPFAAACAVVAAEGAAATALLWCV